MADFEYTLDQDDRPRIGLIVLQSDVRIEQDFRRILPMTADLYVSRVPSGLTVTPDTLQQMQDHIPAAAALMPDAMVFDAIGYGCTSGAAQIGQAQVRDLVRQRADARTVSDPVSALVAACGALGISRLALLSPYVESVSDRLRSVLGHNGLQTPVFGTFAEAEEARVARISQESLVQAATALAGSGDVDGVFLSCTNLNTLDIIEPLETATGLPVLSSNLVLGWHLCHLAGVRTQPASDSRLMRAGPRQVSPQ